MGAWVKPDAKLHNNSGFIFTLNNKGLFLYLSFRSHVIDLIVITIKLYMRKLFLTLFAAMTVACSLYAQENMVAFRHLSIGAEAGLHGFGVEVALPIQKHFVLKAGYNWAPKGDLFNTDIVLDTKQLRQDQEQYSASTGYEFRNKFSDESIVSSGVVMGLTNYKAMINWYPFSSGRFYFAGGVYYTPDANRNDPFIRLSGNTADNDWAALQELNEKYPDPANPGQKREMALDIAGEKYSVVERDGKGYMQADFRVDPLKYYVGMGLGRCVPNRFMGLQLEVGAMIYHNAVLYCQDKEVSTITDAASALGDDTREILEYVDKYPVYPQVTLRLSFRVL